MGLSGVRPASTASKVQSSARGSSGSRPSPQTQGPTLSERIRHGRDWFLFFLIVIWASPGIRKDYFPDKQGAPVLEPNIVIQKLMDENKYFRMQVQELREEVYDLKKEKK